MNLECGESQRPICSNPFRNPSKIYHPNFMAVHFGPESQVGFGNWAPAPQPQTTNPMPASGMAQVGWEVASLGLDIRWRGSFHHCLTPASLHSRPLCFSM